MVCVRGMCACVCVCVYGLTTPLRLSYATSGKRYKTTKAVGGSCNRGYGGDDGEIKEGWITARFRLALGEKWNMWLRRD